MPLLLSTLPANLRLESLRGDMPPAGEWREDLCVQAVVQRHADGLRHDRVGLSEGCDGASIPNLLAAGEERLAVGDLEVARYLFEAAAELRPDNRCPPSLTREIEAVAAAWDYVTLVDLRRAGFQESRDGAPGADLFVDTCHMNWRGYRAMGLRAADAVPAAGLLGTGAAGAPPPRLPDRGRVQGETLFVHRPLTPGSSAARRELPLLSIDAEPGAATTDELRARRQLRRVEASESTPPFEPAGVFGFTGPWAFPPMRFDLEPWATRPDGPASVEIHRRHDGVVAVAGFVSAVEAAALQAGAPGPGNDTRYDLDDPPSSSSSRGGGWKRAGPMKL